MFALLSSLFLSTFCLGDPPQNLPYEWRVYIKSEYENLTENFNATGGATSLITGGSFMHFATKLGAIYRPSKTWSFYSGVRVAYSKSVLGAFERTNSNLTDVFGGVNYHTELKKFELIPTAEVNFSLNQIDLATDDVLLNDGLTNFKLGIWILKDFKRFVPYFYGGIILNNDDYASLYQASIGSKLVFSNWYMFMEVSDNGILKDDGNLATPNVRFDVINRVNAGSYRFYSVNPFHMDVNAGMNYDVSKLFAFGAALNYPFKGERYSKGLSFLFNLTWNFGATDEVRQVIKETIKKKEKKDNRFKEKLEDEDQRYFEDK